MNKLIFLMLGLACFSLEAAHYQTSMSVMPMNNLNEYLVEMQIEKVLDDCTSPQIVASPKMICRRGDRTQFEVESEDEIDLLRIQVMIEEEVQLSVLMKEKGETVLSFDHVIKLN